MVSEVYHRWQGTADRDWRLGGVAAGTITIDRDQITLALDALVENAVQHTRAGDTIEIGSRAAGGALVVVVRDTGDGIPEAAQTRVFDRFYRVDGSRNRRHGGVGLGLAIVKAVVEAHGGGVSVRSRQGAGSVFEIRLPGLRSAGDEPVAPASDRLDHGFGVELAP
jgi:signal transduction histidine kinase